MEKDKKISLGKKLKSFFKQHKDAIIGLTVTGAASIAAIVLYGQNQRLKGENSNLKSLHSGNLKTIERQAYIIGKQNQKLYGK